MKMLIVIIKKLLNSLRFSVEGLAAVWKHELSFRLELCVCLVAAILVFIIPFELMEKLLLIISMLLLLGSELFNTAVESVVDRISLERHPLSKQAKDASSAAVAIIIIMNVIAWIFALIHVFLKN